MKRGRPSRASLMVQSDVLETIERLQPPRHLTDEQRAVWWPIVSGHPVQWFDAGSVPLLAQLCRHVVMANRIADLIEHTNDTAELLTLLSTQRMESEAIRKIATSLRITPQSVINIRGNKTSSTAARDPHTLVTYAS
jgi:hypothetical protein